MELAQKLGIQADSEAFILHGPPGYAIQLGLDSADTESELSENLEWIQAFYTERKKLEEDIGTITTKLSKTGQLWLSWPKKTSGITTDLSDAIVRETGLGAGLVDVKVASINDTWSGLKFVYRTADR